MYMALFIYKCVLVYMCILKLFVFWRSENWLSVIEILLYNWVLSTKDEKSVLFFILREILLLSYIVAWRANFIYDLLDFWYIFFYWDLGVCILSRYWIFFIRIFLLVFFIFFLIQKCYLFFFRLFLRF